MKRRKSLVVLVCFMIIFIFTGCLDKLPKITVKAENLDLTEEGFKYIPHYIENIKQVVDFKYREQCSDIVHGDDDFGDFSNEIYNSVLKAWAFNKKYIRLYNEAWNNISNWYFTIQYTKKDVEEEVSS